MKETTKETNAKMFDSLFLQLISRQDVWHLAGGKKLFRLQFSNSGFQNLGSHI